MIHYHFNKEIQVLEVRYEGDISEEDIIKHSLFVANNKNFPRILKIITDSTNAHYTFSPTIIKKLLIYVEESLRNYEFIKDAFIHSNPIETAYSHLLEIEQNHDNYSHRIFSTKKAAIHWLIN